MKKFLEYSKRGNNNNNNNNIKNLINLKEPESSERDK
jgi:hypothetical protein